MGGKELKANCLASLALVTVGYFPYQVRYSYSVKGDGHFNRIENSEAPLGLCRV